MNGQIAAGGSGAKLTDFGFHYQRASGGPAISKANIETAFQAAVAVPVCAALNNRWAQTHNTVRLIDDALDAPYLRTRAVAGGVAGDSMSTIVAAFQLFRTGVRGKSFRGSKHFGPLSESDTTAGSSDVLNAGALTNFGAIATAALAGFTDSDGNVWSLQIVSRVLSQLRINPTLVVSTPVIEIHTNHRIGRMRHREVASVY